VEKLIGVSGTHTSCQWGRRNQRQISRSVVGTIGRPTEAMDLSPKGLD